VQREGRVEEIVWHGVTLREKKMPFSCFVFFDLVLEKAYSDWGRGGVGSLVFFGMLSSGEIFVVCTGIVEGKHSSF
jgi:hypothetical protein